MPNDSLKGLSVRCHMSGIHSGNHDNFIAYLARIPSIPPHNAINGKATALCFVQGTNNVRTDITVRISTPYRENE